MADRSRREFLRRAALLAAGAVAADQLELLERLGWERRSFPGYTPDVGQSDPPIQFQSFPAVFALLYRLDPSGLESLEILLPGSAVAVDAGVRRMGIVFPGNSRGMHREAARADRVELAGDGARIVVKDREGAAEWRWTG